MNYNYTLHFYINFVLMVVNKQYQEIIVHYILKTIFVYRFSQFNYIYKKYFNLKEQTRNSIII